MSCNFHVGQKVVLVGCRPEPGEAAFKVESPPGLNAPVLGSVYTVRAKDTWADIAVIMLVEIDNRHMIEIVGSEPGFLSRAFRPLITRPTSIEVFRKLLNPARVDA